MTALTSALALAPGLLSLCSGQGSRRGPAAGQASGRRQSCQIAAVETQLARLPLPGGAWQDAIRDVTQIERVVTDVTTETGLVGTGFAYTGGVGGRTLKAMVERRHRARARPAGGAARPLAPMLASPPQPRRRGSPSALAAFVQRKRMFAASELPSATP